MDPRTHLHPAPALAVTVEIVADDIEQGHIAKCRSCPAARATNRATGRFCDTGGFHLIAYDNPQYLENDNLWVGLLPEPRSCGSPGSTHSGTPWWPTRPGR